MAGLQYSCTKALKPSVQQFWVQCFEPDAVAEEDFLIISSSTDALGVQDVARPDGAGEDAPQQHAAAPGQQPNGNRPASPLSVEMQHRLTHRPGGPGPGIAHSQNKPNGLQVRRGVRQPLTPVNCWQGKWHTAASQFASQCVAISAGLAWQQPADHAWQVHVV